MADQDTPGAGHNSKTELTEAQKEALFFNHLGKIKRQKDKLASVNGELRALYKAGKSDGFTKKDFEIALELEDDEDGKFEARRARGDQIAKWMQVPIGAQADLFVSEPAVEKAFRQGRAAGLKGERMEPPFVDQASEAAQKWIEGWHKGQAEIFNIRAPLLTDRPLPEGAGNEDSDDENDELLTDGAEVLEQMAADDAADAGQGEEEDLRPRFNQEAAQTTPEKPKRERKPRVSTYNDEYRSKNGGRVPRVGRGGTLPANGEAEAAGIGTVEPTHRTTN